MSTIPLRDYCQKIESLIDIGNNDEAVFHALSILNIYPKLTVVYRSLGQALLELKRYEESAEVFSKVLAVFPDDFISHVGLSAIKENELDLDKAIYHMEQAFDVQPSNVVVQEELRRLLGRRDGVSPNKIRLSRGALIRMYLKGELYQQAISEIHAFQKIEPGRVDLDIILSKIYAMTGRLDESVEISNKVVQQLPYCFESNKLLSIHGDLSEKNTHKTRLIEIDPYNQFVGEQYQISDDVPADTILIEEEIYSSPEQDNASIPDWARNVGLNWIEEPASVDQSDSPQIEWSDDRVSPFTSESAPLPLEEIRQNQDSIDVNTLPDWMRNAGWTKESESNGISDDPLSGESIPDPFIPVSDQDNPEPADEALPEWMKEAQSNNVTVFPEVTEGIPPEKTDDNVGILDNSPLEWIDSEEKDLDDVSRLSSEEIAQPVELPDWLKNYEVEVPESELDTPEQKIDSLDSKLPPFEEIPPLSEESPIEEVMVPEDDPINNAFQFNPLSNADFSEKEEDIPATPSTSESVPDWVKKILGGSSITSALQESAVTPSDHSVEEIQNDIVGFMENEDLNPEPQTNETPSMDEEIDIPEFITELPNDSPAEGLINDETNAELISWLDEVTAEELDQSAVPAAQTEVTSIEDDSPLPDLSLDSLIGESESTFEPEIETNEEEQPAGLDVEPDIDDRLSGLLDTSETSTIIDDWLGNADNPVQDSSLDVDNIAPDISIEESDQSLTPDKPEQVELPVEITFPEEEFDPGANTNGLTTDIPEESQILQSSPIDQIKLELEAEPNSYEKWLALGDAYFQTEQIESAIDAYRQAEIILNNTVKE